MTDSAGTPALPELRWGAATDPGRVRAQNEDAFAADGRVFAVADGMGGHQAGEVASAMAIESLQAGLAETATDPDELARLVRQANREIHDAARSDAGRTGMGTTVTAMAVIAVDTAETADSSDAEDEHDTTPRLALVNVGDSRTYRLRDGGFQRLTVDHSYVQELVSAGQLTDDEARIHPHRNIVTRALGIETDVAVDAWTVPILRGDRFLLCSDGLVDEVSDSDISELLTDQTDAQQAAAALVNMANERGGRDNITVVVLDVIGGPDPRDQPSLADLEPVWADEPTTASATTTAELPVDPADEALAAAMATPDDITAPLSRVAVADRATVNADADAESSLDNDTTEPAPTPEPEETRRRSRLGIALFVLVAAAILTLVVVVIAVAVSRPDGDSPPDTTVVAPSTTLVTTTPSTTTPSTTTPSTTTPSTTSPPAPTTPPPG